MESDRQATAEAVLGAWLDGIQHDLRIAGFRIWQGEVRCAEEHPAVNAGDRRRLTITIVISSEERQ